jgi:hypothetical protein
MARWLALIALCVAVAGCGDGGGDKAPSRPPEQQEAADVAKRYLEAVSDKDWKAACETRAKSEQQEFAQMGGSCERVFEKIFEGKPVDMFDGAEIGEVRIEGAKAGIDVVQPGQKEAALTIAAVREDGHWLLKDVPDEQTP